MATMDSGFLPTIKCSNCGCNVEISAMGDHTCTNLEHVPMTAIPSPPPSAGFDEPNRLTTAMATKVGRGAPPRIDPSIANSAFLQPNVPTPASSIGSHMPSPHSVSSAPRSPLQPSPRQTSPDDDSVLNLDSVFSFPMPGNKSFTRVSSHGLTMDAPSRPAAGTSPSRYGLGLDLVPENIQLPPSPLPPAPEPTEPTHERNESIVSQSSYRTSLSSIRYGSSTARSSTNSFSRGFTKYIDETPPLPPAPLRTPNKSSFSRESQLSVNSSYQSEKADESFDGFDFGISPNTNPSGLHDLPEERSPEEPKATSEQDFPLPSQNHLHPATAASEPPITNVPRKNSDASTHSAVSVTSFARALGLEDQLQKPESSVSSESSPSEANSGSSMSSLPSDTSLNQFKPNDPLNLSPLVKELPARTRQTILELPGRIRNTMEEVPPIPAAFFSPDSPTDPSINKGGLSLIVEKNEGLSSSPQSPQPPPSEPPSPQRSMQRSATEPIPRPPTRSATKSKGKCKGCGEAITGKSISSSDGRLTGRYHRGCFVCFECSSPFQTADFYILNNKPFCAQHYHERNGSLCSICHDGIEGEYLETVERNGARPERRRFHLGCLQCRTCNVILNGDYYEWNGGIYCERDAHRAANAYYRPPPGPPGPPGRRRPTIGASPLSQTQTRGPPPAGYRPPPSPVPYQGGLRPGPRFPSGGARRFPERRTTKLMMI